MKNYFINCIYSSTEGEGIHIGRPQIFVRFQGCSIGCVNCDSKETWKFQEFPPISLEQVLGQIEKLNHLNLRPLKRLSITGGDPLHPTHEGAVLDLVRELKKRQYYVNIEASGARIVHSIFDQVDFISFDYKTPSTKVKTPLSGILLLIKQYPGKFQIKSVVADEKDFAEVWKAYQEVEKHYPAMDFDWCLTPALGPKEEKLEHFVMMWRKNEELGGPFRVIGQQHKWVFGPEEKRV